VAGVARVERSGFLSAIIASIKVGRHPDGGTTANI
jgi:hypothetical protein